MQAKHLDYLLLTTGFWSERPGREEREGEEMEEVQLALLGEAQTFPCENQSRAQGGH